MVVARRDWLVEAPRGGIFNVEREVNGSRALLGRSDAMQNKNEAGGQAGGPGPGLEIELKLSGQPERLKSAFSSTAIRARATGRGQSKRLENVYYDTDDQRLRARGLAFRVRKDGRRYYQTLKSNDAGGLAAYRGEWQTPAALERAGPRADAGGRRGGAGRPGRAGRAQVGLHHPRAAPGAADRTHRSAMAARAWSRPRSISARSRATAAACRSPRSSSSCSRARPRRSMRSRWSWTRSPRCTSRPARSRRAATRSPRAPRRPGTRPSLRRSRRDATVDDAIQAILRSCVEQWCANEAAAHDGSDPEGVHQMRVAIRRLRSAFSVFGRLIDPASAPG